MSENVKDTGNSANESIDMKNDVEVSDSKSIKNEIELARELWSEYDSKDSFEHDYSEWKKTVSEMKIAMPAIIVSFDDYMLWKDSKIDGLSYTDDYVQWSKTYRGTISFKNYCQYRNSSPELISEYIDNKYSKIGPFINFTRWKKTSIGKFEEYVFWQNGDRSVSYEESFNEWSSSGFHGSYIDYYQCKKYKQDSVEIFNEIYDEWKSLYPYRPFIDYLNWKNGSIGTFDHYIRWKKTKLGTFKNYYQWTLSDIGISYPEAYDEWTSLDFQGSFVNYLDWKKNGKGTTKEYSSWRKEGVGSFDDYLDWKRVIRDGNFKDYVAWKQLGIGQYYNYLLCKRHGVEEHYVEYYKEWNRDLGSFSDFIEWKKYGLGSFRDYLQWKKINIGDYLSFLYCKQSGLRDCYVDYYKRWDATNNQMTFIESIEDWRNYDADSIGGYLEYLDWKKTGKGTFKDYMSWRSANSGKYEDYLDWMSIRKGTYDDYAYCVKLDYKTDEYDKLYAEWVDKGSLGSVKNYAFWKKNNFSGDYRDYYADWIEKYKSKGSLEQYLSWKTINLATFDDYLYWEKRDKELSNYTSSRPSFYEMYQDWDPQKQSFHYFLFNWYHSEIEFARWDWIIDQIPEPEPEPYQEEYDEEYLYYDIDFGEEEDPLDYDYDNYYQKDVDNEYPDYDKRRD